MILVIPSYHQELSFTHAFNHHHKVRFGISQAIRSPFIYEEMAKFMFTQRS